MLDIAEHLAAIDRSVAAATIDGQDVISVRARRSYEAPEADVWAALTDPERLKRWFLPVTGDLRQGGTFQAEGNAGGTIRRCEPPRLLVVTWGDAASVVHLALSSAAGGRTALDLEHTVPRQFAGSGAGALFVAPGWDMALMGLADFLAGDAPADPVAAQNSSQGQAFAAGSTIAWSEAVALSGTATADEVAGATEAALGHWAPAAAAGGDS